MTDVDMPQDPAAQPGQAEVEELLLQLRDIVENARAMPLSASVMVNRDEVVELLEETLALLPEQLREARWLLKERAELLEQASRESERIIETGRVRAERMVERTEVVREARRAAAAIVEEAESRARQIRHEADDYVDRKLAGFEVVLDRTMQTVQKGRERLHAHVGPSPDDEEAEAALDEAAFFDQDVP